MSYQEKYAQARKAGYTDQEIMEHLASKDKTFEDKMVKAQEAGYSPEEVLNYFNAAPKQKEPYIGHETGVDIAKQGTQGFGIGALGTYGDILDLFGLQPNKILPGEKAKYGREFDILQRMEEGHKPSAGELQELVEEDVAPRYSKLPSSKNVETFGKSLGVVSEPETAAGRYAKRIGKLTGAEVALRGKKAVKGKRIASPIAAGTAGQTAEELGLPPWAQAVFEVIAGLKAAPKSKIPITSKSKEVESIIGDLRKAGYSEKDITLAKSALEERKILKKFAKLTPKAENTINQGIKNSESLFKEQIKKGLPGYAEGGLPYLEKQASNVYQAMEELASNVPIKNKSAFRKSIQDSIDYLEKSALLPDEKEFIGFLKEGLEKVDKSETADFLTSFYRKLGKSGNWTDPKTKEHLLTLVKEGVKKSFAESGPEAAKFGKYFEATNESWKHWLNTRDFMQTIEKASAVEGMNFKKLTGILNDPKNHELAKKVLGPEQLENIKTINKGAEAIESLLKQIPPVDKTSKAIKSLEMVRALLTGSFKTLAGIIGLEAAKSLSTKLLIDPKMQNIMKNLIAAAKNNSQQQVAILAQELLSEKVRE